MAVISLEGYDRTRQTNEVGSLEGVWRMPRHLISNLLGLVGAVIGGVLGFYTFDWLRGQGFYGLMVPGALLGLGCSIFAKQPSISRGVVCGLAAAGLGLYTEWRFFPFAADESLSYFLKNVSSLKPVTLLMIAVGAMIAFWLARDAGFPRLSDRRAYLHPRPGTEPPKSE
jgi:hypothetical protein